MITRIKLDLPALAFASFYQILREVKLGDSNMYEAALSQMLIDLEDAGANDWVNEVLDQENLDVLQLTAICSTEQGLVLNVE